MIFFENHPDVFDNSRWVDTNFSGPSDFKPLTLTQGEFKAVPLVVERPLKIEAIGLIINGAGQAPGAASLEVSMFSSNEAGLPLDKQDFAASWVNAETISSKTKVVLPFEEITLPRGVHYFCLKSVGANVSIEGQGNFYPWIPAASHDDGTPNYFPDISIKFDSSLTTAPQGTDSIFVLENVWPYLAFKLKDE